MASYVFDNISEAFDVNLRKQWCIPAQANADFVCAMEGVLTIYTQPYEPKHPVVMYGRK